MAKPKLRLFKAFRLSRKFALVALGTLVLIGGSGAAAVAFAPAHLVPGFGGNKSASCKTVYKSQYSQSAEKRVLTVIASDAVNPAERVRTGIRIARAIAEGGDHPDLVIVHVADMAGPTLRSQLRGYALGAEIVHAPEHGHTRATDREWEVRYLDAAPNAQGLYFGDRLQMDDHMVHEIAASIEKPERCDLDAPETETGGGDHQKSAGHDSGKKADAHGSGH